MKNMKYALAAITLTTGLGDINAEEAAQHNPVVQKEIAATLQDTRNNENTLQLEIANNNLPPKTQALVDIATQIRKKIEEGAPADVIQALFAQGKAAYQEARAEYKAKKTAGENVSAIKQAIMAHNTIAMQIKRESLQKDLIIQQEKAKTKQQEQVIKQEKAETEKEKAETEKEKAETEKEKAETQISIALRQRYEAQAKNGTTPELIQQLTTLSQQP
jgi:hypothetical protein